MITIPTPLCPSRRGVRAAFRATKIRSAVVNLRHTSTRCDMIVCCFLTASCARCVIIVRVSLTSRSRASVCAIMCSFRLCGLGQCMAEFYLLFPVNFVTRPFLVHVLHSHLITFIITRVPERRRCARPGRNLSRYICPRSRHVKAHKSNAFPLRFSRMS